MDRRVKERLVGATILMILVVLIVPELLSGPRRPSVEPPGARGIPGQTVTVEVHTHATTRGPAQSAAPTAAPTPVNAAASAAAVPAATPAAASDENQSPAPTPTDASSTIRAEQAPRTVSASTAMAAAGAWAVQFGSFLEEANADKLARKLKGDGYAVYVSSSGTGSATRYRVRMGPLADRDVAERALAQLKAHDIVASIVSPAR